MKINKDILKGRALISTTNCTQIIYKYANAQIIL